MVIDQEYQQYIILMLNCKRGTRESLQRGKHRQKNICAVSFALRSQNTYSDALYLPLREAVTKRIESQLRQVPNYKKVVERSLRIEKSPSLLQGKENKKIVFVGGVSLHKPQCKLKILSETQKRIETDRKPLRKNMEKSLRSIRLKTDYHDILQPRQKESSTSKQMSYNQVSTKHTEEHSNKIIYISRAELAKLNNQFKRIQEEHALLEREIDFYCKSHNKIVNNSVVMALRV